MKRFLFYAFFAVLILSLTFSSGKAAEATKREVREPTSFGERIQAGLISIEPADWNDETRKEFFGNMPVGFHERFLDAFSTLREANGEFWKTRAELFAVLHPLFAKEIEDLKEQAANARKLIEEAEDETQKKQIESAFAYCLGLNEILVGDYTIVAKNRANEYAATYLALAWSEFRHYPGFLDPGKQPEYWTSLADEIIFLFKITAESCRHMAEKQKKQTVEFQKRVDKMTLEDLPDELQGMNTFQLDFCQSSR